MNFNKAKYIWLNESAYPKYQFSNETINCKSKANYNYCISEFKKSFIISKPVAYAQIDIFADTKFRLNFNGSCVGVGPANNGGDFIISKSLPKCYYSTYEINPIEGKNELYAEVQLTPVVHTDTSRGRGCFIAECTIKYTDGTEDKIYSDSSWLARRDTTRTSDGLANYSNEPDTWQNAQEVQSVWDLNKSPIPVLHEEIIDAKNYFVFDEFKGRVKIENNKVVIKNGCPVTFIAKFPMINAAYTKFNFKGGKVSLTLGLQEFIGKSEKFEKIISDGDFSYRGFRLQSIGYIEFCVTFCDENDCVIENIGIVSTHYPITKEGSFKCNEESLNEIYELGKHTEKICRQSLHLDSPMHQEPLACTGDYYIESLIDYYCFGDTKLTRFDIIRTCDLLRITKGEMFHTSYSLILLQMISDYIKYSGDTGILEEIVDTLHILLKRFETYTEDDAIIHNAPNYMFVDWVEVDGYTLHHPPKALGQTVLNAFYYNALVQMVKFCKCLNDSMEITYLKRAKKLKESFNNTFFDNEKGLYFDGLNTPEEAAKDRPKNINNRYFSQQANSLAVLYGICDEGKSVEIMEKVLTDDSLTQSQPYFLHFVLNALYKTELFDKYGMDQIRRWSKLVNECNRGLKEVWTGFACDYSHAWGATPSYQLPSKILGLEMIENGYKEIKLRPNLFGLEFAKIKVPTPFGYITASLNKNGENKFDIPHEIKCEIV
ncbi:MAG TPA: amylo-alpha-1,6-glucosidase [Clostridia bacterium]|nr:amylo-alpha-1,6-glucosidase [Clostridia bacterium]